MYIVVRSVVIPSMVDVRNIFCVVFMKNCSGRSVIRVLFGGNCQFPIGKNISWNAVNNVSKKNVASNIIRRLNASNAMLPLISGVV